MNRRVVVACLVFFFGDHAGAASLEDLPEFLRPDPFGDVIAIDKAYAGSQADTKMPFTFTGARSGYVSFHLLVKLPEGGNYRIALNIEDRSGKIQADLFREWFPHFGKKISNTEARKTRRRHGEFSVKSPCTPCLRGEFFWLRLGCALC